MAFHIIIEIKVYTAVANRYGNHILRSQLNSLDLADIQLVRRPRLQIPFSEFNQLGDTYPNIV